MIAILRQAAIRGVPDEARFYRDYVLGTGRLHHVWELADRAFALAGFELAWQLDGDDPLEWRAAFADTGEPAVVVDPAFIRPSDPHRDRAPTRAGSPRTSAGSRAPASTSFLEDMLAVTPARTQP